MGVLASVIFLLTVTVLVLLMLSEESRRSVAAVVIWYREEDKDIERTVLGCIREEEASGVCGRQVIVVSADGRFGQGICKLAEKYGIRLVSADELSDTVSRLGKDTWEVKNE